MARSPSHLIPLVALVVVAAGCVNTGPAPRSSPSVSPTAVPTVSPAQTPEPTPQFPTVDPAAAGLSCRLPVAFAPGAVTTQPAEGRLGFVQFPEGRVTIAYSFPFGSDPYAIYLGSVNRWVPANWEYILPDGSRYVIWESLEQQPPYRTRLHFVETATGQERVLTVEMGIGTRDAYFFHRYAPEGIYLVAATVGTEGGHGLWLLDTSTGVRREITPSGVWSMVAAGAAWGYANDDTVAPPPPGYAGANSVVRLDLRTGQPQVWLVTPGRRIDIAGVDEAGRLLVMVSNGPGLGDPGPGAELRLLSAPGQWQTYPVPQAATHAGFANAYPTGISDANGVWTEDGDAIYLFDQQHGLRLVMTGRYLRVAGRCD